MIGSTPKRIGSVQGRPSASAVAAHSRARLVAVERRGVEADADRAHVRAGQPRRLADCAPGISASPGSARPGSPRMCGAAGLVAQHERLGLRAVQQPESTRRRSDGWNSEPCPSIRSQPSSSRAGASRSIAPEMKSATTASTGTPSPAIRMPVCPVARKSAATPRALQRRGSAPASRTSCRPSNRCRRSAAGARRADSRCRPSRSGGRIAHVEQLQPARSRQRRPAAARRAAAGAGPAATFIPASSAAAASSIRSAPSRAARTGDAEHQRPRARRRGLGHRQPRQAERQRAIVVAEFADAILAPELGEPARGLDADEVGAVAEIEEIGRRDHRPQSVTAAAARPRIASARARP